MSKFFTYVSLAVSMLTVASTDAFGADYRRTWDFRNGWSQKTLTNLALDTKNWEVQGTGFQNKIGLSGTTPYYEVGGVKTNIPELEGLTVGCATSAKHIQVYDGKTTNVSFPDYACLWINGKNSNDYVEFTVPARENVKFGYCSHKAGEARGFSVVGSGFADADGNTTFTSKPDGTVVDVELINSNTEDATLRLKTTNGSHIYYIIIGEGDAPKSYQIGYLYYDAAGNGFEELPLYTAVKEMESVTFNGLNLNGTLPTTAELQAYDAVVIDGTVPADEAIVANLKENIQWQPTLNTNPALAQALGYGEVVEAAEEGAWALNVSHPWFSGYEAWAAESYFPITNGEEMPKYIAIDDKAAGDIVIAAGTEEGADSTHALAYVRNAGHNQYVYYGVSSDFNEETSPILKNILQDALDSKSEVTSLPAPYFEGEYKEMASYVEIKTLSASAEIHYTTDGTDPTLESPLYTGPVEFTAPGTLKAIAVAEGYTLSDVASFDVLIYHQAQQPQVNVSGNQQTENAVITLTSSEEGVDIWYNFTGSTDIEKSSKYDGPITLTRTATITAFAESEELGLVKSEPTTVEVKANTQNVRRDEVAHFKVTGNDWNVLDNLSLNGEPMTAWVASNYYFSWGKSAQASTYDSEEQEVDENGNPKFDEFDLPIYKKATRPMEVVTNSEDSLWRITSRGQVAIYQSNTLSSTIGDFTGYNPARAEDQLENLATAADIQLGGIATGDSGSAAIESTVKFAGPFNLVAIVANVNGNKTTGVGNPGYLKFEISLDGETWEQLGDTLVTSNIFRNYSKFEEAYNGTDEVYVRIASIRGSSQSVHDLYVFNHGEKSQAEEDAAKDDETGITTVAPAAKAQKAVVKVVKNGQLIIETANGTFTATGARIK